MRPTFNILFLSTRRELLRLMKDSQFMYSGIIKNSTGGWTTVEGAPIDDTVYNRSLFFYPPDTEGYDCNMATSLNDVYGVITYNYLCNIIAYGMCEIRI